MNETTDPLAEHMKIPTADGTTTSRVRSPKRRPLPDIADREWMTALETAQLLGCSPATVHRLRRGIISGVPILPAVSVGTRKFIFRKETVQRWQDENENAARAK